MSDDKKPRSHGWRSWAGFFLILALVYFANVELQSWLGRKALANTGLEPLSLNQALQNAKKEHKLILADMSAIWCQTCRKLDNEVFSDPRVKQAIKEKYIFSRVEYESDEGEIFMKQYAVKGFPTLLILDSNGNKLKQLNLVFDPESFIAQL